MHPHAPVTAQYLQGTYEMLCVSPLDTSLPLSQHVQHIRQFFYLACPALTGLHPGLAQLWGLGPTLPTINPKPDQATFPAYRQAYRIPTVPPTIFESSSPPQNEATKTKSSPSFPLTFRFSRGIHLGQAMHLQACEPRSVSSGSSRH